MLFNLFFCALILSKEHYPAFSLFKGESPQGKGVTMGLDNTHIISIVSLILNHYLGCKFATDVVVGSKTRLDTEVEAATDDVVPITLGKMRQVVTAYAVFDESIEDACIEVIACTYGAHGSNGFDAIMLGERAAM